MKLLKINSIKDFLLCLFDTEEGLKGTCNALYANLKIVSLAP